MTNQNEKLARALEALKGVERSGVVRSSDLSQTYRSRLVKAGFLVEVLQGWLLVTHPDAPQGSSVAWYSSFWNFVGQYLESRFGEGYCLSAEASVKRHVQSAVIPSQVSVMAQENVRQVVPLQFDTSLNIYSTATPLPANRVKAGGLWVMDLSMAICRLAEPFYRTSPEDAELALRLIRDPSELLRVLLDGRQSIVAGRLVRAYQFLGSEAFATQIKDTMAPVRLLAVAEKPDNPGKLTRCVSCSTQRRGRPLPGADPPGPGHRRRRRSRSGPGDGRQRRAPPPAGFRRQSPGRRLSGWLNARPCPPLPAPLSD